MSVDGFDSIWGIPYSQALRVRRICSNQEDEDTHLDNLKQQLLNRQYKEEHIDQQIRKAKAKPRKDLLQYKIKHKTQRVPCVVTYNPAFEGISKIISSHMPILHADSTLKEIFPLPPVVSFRRPRNIRDLLVNAKLREIPSDTQIGSTKCNAKRCSVCPFICESKKFRSSNTGESFPITTHIDCKSSWLIYLITCTKCQQQYVDKTSNTLYTRFTGTKSDIKNNKKVFPSFIILIAIITASQTSALWKSNPSTLTRNASSSNVNHIGYRVCSIVI